MFLQYKQHQVHYTQFGQGDRLLIVFHGFGDNSELFLKLQSGLEERYTVIAIDAPFHGETQWNRELFFPRDIKRIVDAIRKELGFERFSMMAHSMGGLFLMGVFKYFARFVDEVILLAPAGLSKSVIYNKFLFNLPMRHFFKWTTAKPKVRVRLLDLSKKWGWLDRITHIFFTRQLSDEKLRKRMFNTWASLYFFPRNLIQFRRQLRRHKVELLIIYGAKDTLTPSAGGEKFAKKLNRRKKPFKVEIESVNDGHFFIREPLNQALARRFAPK